MINNSWDVDKYKTEHESDEHWELRKKFMLAHKDTLPEDEIVCMAQVFTNIEFLGCRYPDETMIKVAKLAEGVVEEFREKKKNTLKRTFVAASDAASSKVKGVHKRLKMLGDTYHKLNFISSNEQPNIPRQKVEGLPGPFGQIVVFLDAKNSFNALIRTTSANNAQLKIEGPTKNEENQFECKIFIKGHEVSSESSNSPKEAKKKAAEAAIEFLRQQCYSIALIPDRYCAKPVNKSDINSLAHSKIELSEDNIGNKLMRLMGWTGGGLGSSAQGIVEPLVGTSVVRRQGLGLSAESNNPKNNNVNLRNAAKKYITDWINNGETSDLEFSTDFSKNDRKIIHQVAQTLNVKSKSYGKGSDRKLVLSRNKSVWDIVEDLIKNDGVTDKYMLLSPGAPLPTS